MSVSKMVKILIRLPYGQPDQHRLQLHTLTFNHKHTPPSSMTSLPPLRQYHSNHSKPLLQAVPSPSTKTVPGQRQNHATLDLPNPHQKAPPHHLIRRPSIPRASNGSLPQLQLAYRPRHTWYPNYSQFPRRLQERARVSQSPTLGRAMLT